MHSFSRVRGRIGSLCYFPRRSSFIRSPGAASRRCASRRFSSKARACSAARRSARVRPDFTRAASACLEAAARAFSLRTRRRLMSSPVFSLMILPRNQQRLMSSWRQDCVAGAARGGDHAGPDRQGWSGRHNKVPGPAVFSLRRNGSRHWKDRRSASGTSTPVNP